MRRLAPEICQSVHGGLVFFLEHEFPKPVIEPQPALDANYSPWDHFWLGALVSATIAHLSFNSDMLTLASAVIGGAFYTGFKSPQIISSFS